MGELFLTSPKQNKMNPLCLPFKYRPFINDVLFHWLYPLSKFGTIIYSSLARTFPTISRPCTALLGWLDSSIDLFFTHVIRPWFRRLFHRLNLVLNFRRIYLRFIFLCFILILRKAHRRHILVSKDFIRLWLFAFCGLFWMKLQKWRIPT